MDDYIKCFSHVYTNIESVEEVNKYIDSLVEQSFVKEQIIIYLFEFMNNPGLCREHIISIIDELKKGRNTGIQYVIFNHGIDIEADGINCFNTATHISSELKLRFLSAIKNETLLIEKESI